MKHSITRRDFLKVAGVGLGATVLTCSGLTALAAYTPTIDFYGVRKHERQSEE
jgi:hypothetical protein